MKKFIAMLLAALMLPLGALAVEISIPGRINTQTPVLPSYPDNPIIPGVSGTTGLPFEGVYVPILIVLDNAESAYPHWGVSQADIIYQAPNAGKGATKLLALFADNAPKLAGGVRSARAPFVDAASTFGAAFAYAGHTSEKLGSNVDVPTKLKAADMQNKKFNLLGNHFNSREKHHRAPHNLSCHVEEIKNSLIAKGVQFTQRPMLFSDTLPETGLSATQITVNYPMDDKGTPNPASLATYTYDAQNNYYVRSNSSGPYIDMDTNEVVPFANVIVQRVDFAWQSGYIHLKNFNGSGAADIFSGGKYISGSWVRNGKDARTVFVDEQGNEFELQRGKTFIVIADENTIVSYK
ncbi:MAG: DUF3048 domain-containing protein [Eubacteriales bacterium]|nr:DUF3048 domain-containing protein [Eubacteriales bacterium]